MDYVYSVLLLHAAKQEVNEANVKKVLSSSGFAVDDSKVKAMLAALEGVNIEEALKAAASAPVAAAAPAQGEKKAEAPKEDESKKEEAAVEGLASLFG